MKEETGASRDSRFVVVDERAVIHRPRRPRSRCQTVVTSVIHSGVGFSEKYQMKYQHV